MKSCIFLILVFLCLAGASRQTLESSTTSTSSRGQSVPRSPFALKDKLPGCFLRKVVPSGNKNPTCHGLWNSTGYVCNKRAVLSWSTKDTKYIMDGVEVFKNSLDLLSIVATRILGSPVKGLKLNETEIAILKTYKDATANAAKIANAQICASALAKIRNSALCSLCSAENYRFFSDDKKGFLPYDTCQAFNLKCDPYFKNIAEFFGAFPLIVRLDLFFNPLAFVLNDVLQKQFTAGVKRTAQRAAFLSSRILQLSANPTDSQKEIIFKDLCQRMITLTQQPEMIRSLQLMNFNLMCIRTKVDVTHVVSGITSGNVKETIQAFGTLGKGLLKTAQNLAKPKAITNNPLKSLVSNWRNLQITDQYTDFLMSYPMNIEGLAEVIVVKPTDSMFTSFEGADGTSLSHENSCKKIMNMSICFP